MPKSNVRVRREPLTYERHKPVSYFQDLVLSQHGAGEQRASAAERLNRHRQEMDVLVAEKRGEPRLPDGLEVRVTPSRTQGQGGYFAPPAWLNEDFATAARPARVLADLAPGFDLPANASSVNLPIITTGSTEQGGPDNSPVPEIDLVDAAGSSTVATIDGKVDVSLQLLEQSPPGAHMDWAMFKDLAAAYDTQLETQLILGAGSAAGQLTGVTNVANITTTTWTTGSPNEQLMYNQLGVVVSQLSNKRKLPPEAWLMRGNRWAWMATSTDSSNRPFVLPGGEPPRPDTHPTTPAVAALLGWPIYTDEVIPNTLGAGSNQDELILLRPTDLMVLEGEARTSVHQEVLSGTLGIRLIYRNYAAAITNRYPSGISILVGTGMILPAGFN